MKNPWISIGALWAGLGVGMGAFGAHGLEAKMVDLKALGWWETAASYQLWHGLALVLFGLFRGAQSFGKRPSQLPGWFLFVGSLIFSATLYAMALGAPRWLGAITPIGGTALILGWASFAWVAREVRPTEA